LRLETVKVNWFYLWWICCAGKNCVLTCFPSIIWSYQ